MARWYRINLEFRPPLEGPALVSLRQELADRDYDAPAEMMTEHGIAGGTWRSPLLEVPELVALLEKHGARGHGWMRQDSDADPERFQFGAEPGDRADGWWWADRYSTEEWTPVLVYTDADGDRYVQHFEGAVEPLGFDYQKHTTWGGRITR